MAVFNIEIAGYTAEVRSLFESTRDYCRRYLSDREPDFSVTVTREDLLFEQQFLLEEARQEGIRPRIFTDPFLERTSIQRQVAEQLLNRNVLLFHGSTVAVDGSAYLFTAACGTGKSTHTRLWREVFGDRAVMINDDKPFLKFTESGILACGAPWSGKHGLDTNLSVPLKGICILERGSENSISPASREKVFPQLLHQACPPLDDSKLPVFHALVQHLADTVPLWQMSCTKEHQAAVVAFDAMSR